MTFFFSHILQNFRLSRQNCHLQLKSGQIILFRLKSHYFRSYFLCMMRYNMLHDRSTTACDPHDPQLNIWRGGRDTPKPPGLTPMISLHREADDQKIEKKISWCVTDSFYWFPIRECNQFKVCSLMKNCLTIRSSASHYIHHSVVSIVYMFIVVLSSVLVSSRLTAHTQSVTELVFLQRRCRA